MKNVKLGWKNQRQPGIPSNQCWGSREWRRYEERQEKAAERRRTRKEAQDAALTVAFTASILSIAKILLLIGLGWSALHGNRWATLAIAGWAVYRAWFKKR